MSDDLARLLNSAVEWVDNAATVEEVDTPYLGITRVHNSWRIWATSGYGEIVE